MSTHLRTAALLLLTVFAAAAAAPSAAVQAHPPAAEVLSRSGTGSEQERAEAAASWTPERMAAAEPAGVRSGGSGTAPARRPPPEAADRPWTGGGAVAATTGRVFLTMNGRDSFCSATVVPAENRSTVVTAGHCLKDGPGEWAREWTFVPGYESGRRPYGGFAARAMVVPEQWGAHGEDGFDFGMAVLDTNEQGVPVAEETGHQRIGFDTGAPERAHSFGYPADGDHEGGALRYCEGETRPDRRGTTASGMPCTMTQGSSGGPWFADFDPATGTGTIISVIGFAYADAPGVQYGPRLGEEARAVYQIAGRL